MITLCFLQSSYGGLDLVQEQHIWVKLATEEKACNFSGIKSYLFCVGFDLLGGTLLKLDFSFLYGFFSFSCNFSKDCEGSSVVEVDSRLFWIRDLAASASSMLECRISTNVRSKEAIAVRFNFITDALFRIFVWVDTIWFEYRTDSVKLWSLAFVMRIRTAWAHPVAWYIYAYTHTQSLTHTLFSCKILLESCACWIMWCFLWL